MNALHVMLTFSEYSRKRQSKEDKRSNSIDGKKVYEAKKWKKIIINDFQGTHKKDLVKITKKHELTLMLRQIKRIQIDLYRKKQQQ